jgi:hypothetical protein
MGLSVLRLGLSGACAAFGLGVVTMLALASAMRGLDLSLFPNFHMGFLAVTGIVLQWVVAGVLAVTLCFSTAYVSVMRALKRMI